MTMDHVEYKEYSLAKSRDRGSEMAQHTTMADNLK
jgi:hypothetical protein